MARILAPSSVPRIRTAWTENRDIPGDMMTVDVVLFEGVAIWMPTLR